MSDKPPLWPPEPLSMTTLPPDLRQKVIEDELDNALCTLALVQRHEQELAKRVAALEAREAASMVWDRLNALERRQTKVLDRLDAIEAHLSPGFVPILP